jgi:hypothetical protein
MPQPKAFRTFAEFEREFLRPGNRLGLTVEDMVEDNTFENEVDFEDDPFSEMAKSEVD